MHPLALYKAKLNHFIWQRPLHQCPPLQRLLVTVLRLAYVLIRDFLAGEINLRAMSLVYTSLLSLVPLLALAFSLLKAFGMNNALRPMLEKVLMPLGEQAEPLIGMILGFVSNVRVGVLGVIGLAILLYSVVSLIQKIEAGCNAIWQVRQLRPLRRRFTEYLSVLVIGPLVVVSALSLTASFSSNTFVEYLSDIEPFGSALYLSGRLLPYFILCIVFTFLYMFMPNTQVKLLPALAGGLFAGILWQSASIAFTQFASSSSNVNAIYSSFAILILLLIWLYISWLIILMGCRVAFLIQNPQHLRKDEQTTQLDHYERELLALEICTLIAERFMSADTPWSVDVLAARVSENSEQAFLIVEALITADILVETGPQADQVQPKRDLSKITVNEIFSTLRQRQPSQAQALGPTLAPISLLMNEREVKIKKLYQGLTLKDLAQKREA